MLHEKWICGERQFTRVVSHISTTPVTIEASTTTITTATTTTATTIKVLTTISHISDFSCAMSESAICSIGTLTVLSEELAFDGLEVITETSTVLLLLPIASVSPLSTSSLGSTLVIKVTTTGSRIVTRMIIIIAWHVSTKNVVFILLRRIWLISRCVNGGVLILLFHYVVVIFLRRGYNIVLAHIGLNINRVHILTLTIVTVIRSSVIKIATTTTGVSTSASIAS